jgi:hypothetical protein
MISSLQDRLRPPDAATFSATAHSAGRVSPNGRLCVTTSTGSNGGGFSSRAEVSTPIAGTVPTTPGAEPMPPRLPLI